MSSTAAKKLRQTTFLLSAADKKGFVTDLGHEIAFAGRSNAGKSSALNAITEQTNLARTSKTPGRTQLVNFLKVTDGERLVDLPGYGFAKVPPRMKKQWQALMQDYFTVRKSLQAVFLVTDIRHAFKPFDIQMLEWAEHYDVAVHILLTKADKLKRGAAKNILLKARKELKEEFPDARISAQLFSSLDGQGVEEAQKAVIGFLEN